MMNLPPPPSQASPSLLPTPSPSLPPPPPLPTSTSSPYITNIAQSMTIEEMRDLHKHALAEAESKRTELRLVLASRYRELVGSSDEVLHMQKRARELDDLVNGLKSLVDKLIVCAHCYPSSTKKTKEESSSSSKDEEGKTNESLVKKEKEEEEEASFNNNKIIINSLRRELSTLPRLIHRFLDKGDVHSATTHLLQLFTLIIGGSSSSSSSSSSHLSQREVSEFQLAITLSSSFSSKTPSTNSVQVENMKRVYHSSSILQTQAKMMYLHSQTLPSRIVKMAKQLLLKPASYSLPAQYLPSSSSSSSKTTLEEANYGAFLSASALSTLDMLSLHNHHQHSTSSSIRSINLIDLYYESKAKLIHSLLLSLSSADASSTSEESGKMGEAEMILTQIVLILQYDVILHPYQMFVLRKFPIPGEGEKEKNSSDIMKTLPMFDADTLKSKSSHFLAAHLPLIRSKVKSVLITIAGTTASRLGHIRQILYDKTDGVDCKELLDGNGVCTWEEAVTNMVDVRVVSHGTTFSSSTTTTTSDSSSTALDAKNANQASSTITTTKKFSLWSALFSSAFSSLVHSLLTTSFHSVHSRILSALRNSLGNAPPLHRILPHEAQRNALIIATELDLALKKVSDDAHELLVHAEEREESERRLRQSLYVQTCEIMGRLLSELRRMLAGSSSSLRGEKKKKGRDATKELIVGRLCHLLKFRLTSLPKLLDPESSPSALGGATTSSSLVGIGGGIPGAAGGGAGGGGTGGKSGMITLMELQSSFDLADDDDDGLISFEEAMEAMESAFSGTPFRGGEMVRDTLLLSSTSSTSSSSVQEKDGLDVENMASASTSNSASGGGIGPRNVTLSELALLSARGLRHDASGPYSARGTVQRALDDIVHSCFHIWSKVALEVPLDRFKTSLKEFGMTAKDVGVLEWERQSGLYVGDEEKGEHELLMDEIGDFMEEDDHVSGEKKKKKKEWKVGGVSSYITCYLLSAASVLNRSVCPSDSLPPVPSTKYALSLGVNVPKEEEGGFEAIPNMMCTVRGAVLEEALRSLCGALEEFLWKKRKDDDEEEEKDGGEEDDEEEDLGVIDTEDDKEVLFSLEEFNVSSLIQLLLDVTFVKRCFFERNRYGFVIRDGGNGGDGAVDALLGEFGGELDDDDDGLGEDFMEETKNFVEESKVILENLVERVSTQLATGNEEDEDSDDDVVDVPNLMEGPIRERQMEVFTSCDLFFSSLFGEDSSMSSSSATSSLYGMGLPSSSTATSNNASASLILNPLPSSRRFVLLPIQAERSLNELQLRGKYGKDRADSKANSAGKEEAPSSGAMSSGFGFFSNMLKKK